MARLPEIEERIAQFRGRLAGAARFPREVRGEVAEFDAAY